jgi:hypothetical protein
LYLERPFPLSRELNPLRKLGDNNFNERRRRKELKEEENEKRKRKGNSVTTEGQSMKEERKKGERKRFKRRLEQLSRGGGRMCIRQENRNQRHEAHWQGKCSLFLLLVLQV